MDTGLDTGKQGLGFSQAHLVVHAALDLLLLVDQYETIGVSDLL